MLRLIHLSDLHLRLGWHEEQGVVLSALFEDLTALNPAECPTFLVFSGDIVQAGASSESFDLFHKHFESRLEAIGISRSHRVFVPGNHDLSQDIIKNRLNTFIAMRDRNLGETSLNNALYGEYSDAIKEKFANYFSFERRTAAFGVRAESFCGRGHLLCPSVGIYTLNTAIFSLGGVPSSEPHEGQKSVDEGRLVVETRRLHEWLQTTDYRFRILVMHHPVDILCTWAREELITTIDRHFNMVLVGHVHKPDARYCQSTTTGTLICTAPALFTSKRDALGYCILTINDDLQSIKVHYRQLSRNRKFVNGTYFSNTDDGSIPFGVKPEIAARAECEGATLAILKSSFERASTCAPAIGCLWVPPALGAQPEVNRDEDALSVHADEFVVGSEDTIIFAPPQFGLTALGRFFALDTWQKRPGEACLYFMCDDLPNHPEGIKTRVKQEMAAMAASEARIGAFVLDDFEHTNSLNLRKLRSLKTAYPRAAIILLCKLEPCRPHFLEAAPKEFASFKTLFLWSLTRSQVRLLADQYVDAAASKIDANDSVLRSVENLEKLNLHRTPLNVITLFRIADSSVDISPVNRTEMCERFLFLLFTDFAELPRYGTKPDLKDSVYALGAFVEFLIRRGNAVFSKHDFFDQVKQYCEARLLAIEVDVLFMFLVEESLVVRRGDMYYFRFLYWIYFFAAHRMYHNPEFADYVLRDRNYARFPEVIEFYSGIDRRRADLVIRLKEDLECLLERFSERFEVELAFDPYQDMAWTPSPSSLEVVHREIADEAAGSGLPTAIKDHIADRSFDWSSPYTQELRTFVSDSSLGECMRVCVAASTALRNSDHADGQAKMELYAKILETWTRVIQLGVMIAPILCRNNPVSVEGIRFILRNGDAPDEDKASNEEKFWQILMALPASVFMTYEKDITSRRMSPLFTNYIGSSHVNELPKLMSMFLIISSRPARWRETVEKYILSQSKHSFYMLAIVSALRWQLRHGFHTREDKREMIELVGVAVARHQTGAKKPNKKLISKASRAVLGEEGTA